MDKERKIHMPTPLRGVGANIDPLWPSDQDPRRAHMDRMREEENAADARKRVVRAALEALPIKEGRSIVNGMVDAFEREYYAAERQLRDRRELPKRNPREQLYELVELCVRLNSLITELHPQAKVAWGAVGGLRSADGVSADKVIAENLFGLSNVVMTAAEWARWAIILDPPFTAPKKGRPLDIVATRLTALAEIVYKELTGKKKVGRATDGHKEKDAIFSRFLRTILGAYGSSASALSRTRQLKRMGKKAKK